MTDVESAHMIDLASLATLKGRLIAGGISALVLAALLFAFWSFAYARGHTAGALSNAKPLAECKTTLSQVEAAHEALARENEEIRLKSDGLVADVSLAWDAAYRHSVSNPVTYRVCDPSANRRDGEVQIPDATGQPDDAFREPEVGQAGVVAITEAEVSERLNACERDVSRREHLINFINQQKEIHK